MSKIFRNAAVFSACLLAVACTDNNAGAEPAVAPAPGTSVAPPAEAVAESAAPALSPWSGSLDGLAESQLCALDAANGMVATEGKFALQAGQPAAFEGWVAMTNLENPGALTIILDGAQDFQVNARTGVAREDVATAYNTPKLATAGFKAELGNLAIPAGEYEVVLAHDEAGASVICRPNLRVVAN